MEKNSSTTLPKTYFIFDTCLHAKVMIDAFDALVDLCIAVGEKPQSGVARSSYLKQLLTHQLLREMTDILSPDLATENKKLTSLSANPEYREIVKTPVCDRLCRHSF